MRTRLYFIVYVVDHFFSVAYGRPPMTRDFELLSSPMAFLDCEFAVEDDARLVSQLELWSINSCIFDTFGVDRGMAVPQRLLPQLRRLSIALDTWWADWDDRFGRIKQVNHHHKKDVALHFHFAKLYLCSHVFSGASPEGGPYQLSSEMDEFADSAILSASSIIRVIIADQEIKSFLGILPTYFDTVIVFAAVFLLKLVHRAPANIRIDREEILGLVRHLVTVLRNVTAQMHTQHLLSNIATSIRKLLDRNRQSSNLPTEPFSTTVTSGQVPVPPRDQYWLMSPSDSIFLGSYDFLWPQDTDLDFDFSDLPPMPPASRPFE